MRSSFACLSLVFCAACPEPQTQDAGVDRYAVPGPEIVAVTKLTVMNGTRSLPVQVWYPADQGAQVVSEFPVEEFEGDPTRRDQLQGWMAQAPEACTPRKAFGARDAPARITRLPLLVFSHCTQCFRFSFHTLAERLASHGFIVAAPDHIENTRFDSTAMINNAFLATRAQDISAVITALVRGDTSFAIDETRIAVIGHSFGAVTAGKVVETDERVQAGFLIAAPVDSPFLNSGSTARVTKPLSWLLAMEDNSISYLGNNFIRENFVKVPKPNFLVEVENAGHWSFSDIAGLGGDYVPGCGDGVRDPDGGAFTYVDNTLARSITERTVTAWAYFVFYGDESAKAALSVELPGITHVKAR